jgi:hypothetical protein
MLSIPALAPDAELNRQSRLIGADLAEHFAGITPYSVCRCRLCARRRKGGSTGRCEWACTPARFSMGEAVDLPIQQGESRAGYHQRTTKCMDLSSQWLLARPDDAITVVDRSRWDGAVDRRMKRECLLPYNATGRCGSTTAPRSSRIQTFAATSLSQTHQSQIGPTAVHETVANTSLSNGFATELTALADLQPVSNRQNLPRTLHTPPLVVQHDCTG